MITVICPIFNEVLYIENLLKFFISAAPKNKELILIDGGSGDGTVDIIKKWMKENSNIKLLTNEKKYVPYSLNLAINSSQGDPVIRLDAHTEYSNDYFLTILETFKQTNADIVGGPMRAVGKTIFQKSVAYCTSTVFGVGNSKIHRENYYGESDHVYLGAWKRSVFKKNGLFDEKLYRNQDDEFHYRAKSRGLKIILNPRIKSFYYPRNSFLSLAKQYFQYGLFKPLVLKKVKSEIKLRHLIPSLFLLIVLLFSITFNQNLLVAIAAYLVTNLYFSFNNKLLVIEKMISLTVYLIIHLSYGAGFIAGLSKLAFSK